MIKRYKPPKKHEKKRRKKRVTHKTDTKTNARPSSFFLAQPSQSRPGEELASKEVERLSRNTKPWGIVIVGDPLLSAPKDTIKKT